MLRRIYILVIVALIVSTTFIKNYTKRLDQEIFSIKENINYLNDVKQLIQLEYDYLSSPERLLELNNLYLDEKLQHTPRKNNRLTKRLHGGRLPYFSGPVID